MSKNYFINEGNKIGYLPTTFSGTTVGALVESKLVAGADITKGQVVMLSDALTVVPATAAGAANVIGVAMFDAENGAAVSVECEGLFELTAGGAITAPAILSAADGGKVVAQTAMSQDGTTKVVTAATPKLGIALSDASGDGKSVIVKFSI